jgi:uncharacterized PurR-regulated membrane protein YhhQ (DUF165 family)
MSKYIYTAAYIGVIVAANWATSTFGLVSLGLLGLAVTAGTFFAGAALIVRDGLQLHVGRAWMIAAIVAGALISAVTSTPAIAVASGVAFLVSELVDWSVFTPLRPRTLPGAVVVSSIVSAPVDTVLFLYIAGFGVTWQAVLGQFIVKTGLALLVAAGLAWRDRQVVTA